MLAPESAARLIYLFCREEGYLVLSGGLTIHNLRNPSAFAESTAGPLHKQFNQAIFDALILPDVSQAIWTSSRCPSANTNMQQPEARKQALFALTKHKGFRAAHPREDHFVPLYVAAGAGGNGSISVISAQYGAATVAFGL